MSPTPRIKLAAAVRKYVFERDHYQCKSCGQTNVESHLTIDHIIPLAGGGANDISNLQTLCQSCNQSKQHYFDPRFQQHFTL